MLLPDPKTGAYPPPALLKALNFIADFAGENFEITRQFNGPEPWDELEATTEAEPVLNWQEDAREILKELSQ